MSGIFIGETEEDLDIRRSGIGAFRTTTGDVHAATFGQALHDSIIARGYRWITDEFSEMKRGHAIRTGQPVDEFDQVILSAEEATKRGREVGLTPITKPISEASLQALIEARQESNAREDRINRRDGGILTGGVARFITGTGAGLLDPFQLAAGFLPIAPAAKVAAALASAGGAGGRAGVRAAVGAGQGAAGTALLEPFVYASDQREHNDWTMGNAAMNIALGAAVGGVVMPVVGRFSAAERAFRDRPTTIATRPGIVELSPESREAGLRVSIDAVVEGRRVNAADAIGAAETVRVARELQTWADRTRSLADETDAAVAETTAPRAPVRSPDAAAKANLEALQGEARALRNEADDARARTLAAIEPGAVRATLDPITLARIRRVDAELAFGVMSPARRGALEAEHTMLLKGSRDVDQALAASRENLEVQRGQAEESGLRSAAARAEGRADTARAAAERADGMAELARADAARREAAGNLAWRSRATAIETKAEVLQALAERTLRRYAGDIGVDAGDTARNAVRILTADDPAAESLAVLAEMRRGRPERVGVVTPDDFAAQQSIDRAVAKLYGEADQAMMAVGRAADAENTRTRELSAERDALTERAPGFDGDTAGELAAMEKQIAGLEARLKPDIDNHPQSAAIKRTMGEMDAWVAEQNAIADGYPTIASIACRNTGGPG